MVLTSLLQVTESYRMNTVLARHQAKIGFDDYFIMR
jgi:hypothetical protein